MAKPHSALIKPATVNGTVLPRHPPRRRPNADARAREYITNAEVQRLMKAAGNNRNGHRDATMVLLAYRHGLRPVELVTLPGMRSTCPRANPCQPRQERRAVRASTERR